MKRMTQKQLKEALLEVQRDPELMKSAKEFIYVSTHPYKLKKIAKNG